MSQFNSCLAKQPTYGLIKDLVQTFLFKSRATQMNWYWQSFKKLQPITMYVCVCGNHFDQWCI